MKIEVLDHGYVEHVESWGTGKGGKYANEAFQTNPLHDYEAGIIEAARQSTQGSFRGWDADEKLLTMLYNNKHDTPFEFAGMVIEVRAPIAVFREWHRHRTQSYNEASARYAPLPALDYVPTLDRLMMVNAASKNKQEKGTGQKVLTEDDAEEWMGELNKIYAQAEIVYRRGLEIGVAKELARLPMPVGHYSQMRAQATLRNWLGFLTLRMDPNAQYEIRQFAHAVGNVIAHQFPYTWKLFEGNRKKLVDALKLVV